jgi:hypothetical protein
MIIKGTVHNGQIRIDTSVLPEGTEVVITPIGSIEPAKSSSDQFRHFKDAIRKVALHPCENDSGDSFSGADHDRLLYGN